jgi:hypothetical protein
MFWHKDFGINRCFLGRKGGISPWLIAIFGEHVNLLLSTLQSGSHVLGEPEPHLHALEYNKFHLGPVWGNTLTLNHCL